MTYMLQKGNQHSALKSKYIYKKSVVCEFKAGQRLKVTPQKIVLFDCLMGFFLLILFMILRGVLHYFGTTSCHFQILKIISKIPDDILQEHVSAAPPGLEVLVIVADLITQSWGLGCSLLLL